jgi:two-component system sensor histidine kinase BaeS
MKGSLKSKLVLTYLAVALTTVLVVSALIRLTSGQYLMNLVAEEQTASLKQQAQDYYLANGSWDGFYQAYLQFTRQQLASTQSVGANQPSGVRLPDEDSPEGRIRGVLGMVDPQYRAIFPTFNYGVGQAVPPDQLSQKVSVEVNGQTVAWILPDFGNQFRLSAEEQVFLQRTTLAIGLAALAGVLAALLIGLFFAAHLLKPIRLLTQASRAMAHGDLNQQVPVTSKDELGQLTATFNKMSADLDLAYQQRKRMTADITHDLSTPIQIISGYMEMLESGEATLTPQRVEIIKTELEHLRRLVIDLSTLTQVEAGALEFQMERVQPEDLIKRVYNAFQPISERQGVALRLDMGAKFAPVLVDAGRMEQVLKNLVENALRHTPKGGEVSLGVSGSNPVEIWVKDNGEGINREDLPFIFDRFYRVDKARGGNSGKMGLGLAICKALVQAQGGTIQAESAGKGQGTRITIRFGIT